MKEFFQRQWQLIVDEWQLMIDYWYFWVLVLLSPLLLYIITYIKIRFFNKEK